MIEILREKRKLNFVNSVTAEMAQTHFRGLMGLGNYFFLYEHPHLKNWAENPLYWYKHPLLTYFR